MSQQENFEKFISHVRKNYGYSKVSKAIKMMKKEGFNLFLKERAGGIAGIIRSQSDSTRLYSCQITKSGDYLCGTQTPRPCGGLRGGICKHIYLMLFAAIKSEMLTIDEAFSMIQGSETHNHNYNKENIMAIYDEYELAKSGEVEWRSVDLLPEDMMAF